jgi:DICT domain-containing protein
VTENLDGFPAQSLSPNTHLLGLSPPILGLGRLANQYLAHGLEAGDGCILVTTDQGAASVFDSISELVADEAVDFDNLGIVDATGQDLEEDALPCRLESVSTPADLTGIGIGISKLLEALSESGVSDYRVVFDSLSSLLVYTEFERTYKVVHTVTNQIDALDATSISLLSADTDQMQISKMESLFDGLIEVRESDGGPEYRIRGRDSTNDWQPLPVSDRAQTGTAGSPSGPEPVQTEDGTSEPAITSPSSLREIIDTMEASRLTLTLCNAEQSEDDYERLREYFQRHNVAVRTADLSTETPANVALLHQESDVFATSTIQELQTAISVETVDADDLTPAVEPAVLDHVHRNEYAVENGTKLELVRISRLIETQALETGDGALHTGFQRLDRLEDEFHTRELHEAIAQSGVTVHLYGQPGEVPNEEWYTIHASEDEELADSWFVVYDGAGRDARKGALVCEETAPARYTGFWTYQPRIVDPTVSYLDATYGD